MKFVRNVLQKMHRLLTESDSIWRHTFKMPAMT